MPRPKPTFPKVRMHIVFRQEIAAKLYLRFHSEDNETGLLKGGISEFVNAAVEEKLARELSKGG